MTAFVFPGQGSHKVGMGAELAEASAAAREVFEEVDEALGQNLSRIMREGPEEELVLTANAQPAIMANAIAVLRVLEKEAGLSLAATGECVAGHSLGEYTALVAAGALTFADALPLVRFRAQAMQQAVPVGTGAMAAILGLDADAVRNGCAEAAAASGEVCEAVNFNDPKQTVIAGSKAGVEKGCEVLKAKGAKRTLALPVSAPFHSSLMKPAADMLRDRLATVDIAPPRIPVINNVDVSAPADAAAIRDALYRQAYGAVRWVEVVQALRGRGLTYIVECGPGKVLAGMVKRIDGEVATGTVFDPASLAEMKAALA
jgi:[acyl-carrier-protein] S-malonyltransferase